MNPFLRSLCIETLPIATADGEVYVRTTKQQRLDLQGLIKTWFFLLAHDNKGCIRSTSNQKRNMLHLCSEFQNAEFVQLISMMPDSTYAKLLSERDKDDATPLHIAINMFNHHNNSVKFDNVIRWDSKLQTKNDEQTRSSIENSEIIIESYLKFLDVENEELDNETLHAVDRKGDSSMHLLLQVFLRHQVMHKDTLEMKQQEMVAEEEMFIYENMVRQQYQCYQKIIDLMTKKGIDMKLVNAQEEAIDDLVMQSVQNMRILNRLLQSTNGTIKSPRLSRRTTENSNADTIPGVSSTLMIKSPRSSPRKQYSTKKLVKNAIKSTRKFVTRAASGKLTRHGSSAKNVRSFRNNKSKKEPSERQRALSSEDDNSLSAFGVVEVQSDDDENENSDCESRDGDDDVRRHKFLSSTSGSSGSSTRSHLSDSPMSSMSPISNMSPMKQ